MTAIEEKLDKNENSSFARILLAACAYAFLKEKEHYTQASKLRLVF